MQVKIESVFPCSTERLMKELEKIKSFIYVGKPMVHFVELPGHRLPEYWAEGKYLVEMRLFGILPLGNQWIVLSINREERHIRDNGYSSLIKKWDHNITLQEQDKGMTLYRDTIDIEAGGFTPFVVLFAQMFFRWRQKRWRKLINNQFNYEI